MLNLLASFFSVIGIIILPKVSYLYSNGNIPIIKHYIIKLLTSTFIASLAIAFFGWNYGDILLRYYIGSLVEYFDIIKISFLAIVPYSIYVVLRGVIDAIYYKSYNTINIMVALLMLLLNLIFIYISHCSYYYVMYALVIALLCLGALTMKRIIFIIREISEN